MQVSEMVEMTREIITLFGKDEPRAWGIEAMITELTGEVGTLADSVMIKEGYRRPRKGSEIDLEDDIVDVMFMLIRIADYYQVNIEAAYRRMIEETKEKLEKRMQARAQSQL